MSYSLALAATTQEGTVRVVKVHFASQEDSEADLHDDLRIPIDDWLYRHFEEHLADDGDNIENDRGEPDHDEVIIHV